MRVKKRISIADFSKRLKKSAKRYLPNSVVIAIQRTIRPLRRARLRVERALHPESFFHDPFARVDVHYVRPEEINYWGRAATSVFCVWGDPGRILDGDWDLNINDKVINDTLFYTSYEMRVKYGTAWNTTAYYHKVIREIENGEVRWNCRNAKEFDDKCKYWDTVYESIRDDGYIPNGGEDEITVNIDRNGRLLLNDGYHRLVFCKLLGIRQIPVNVVVRHRKWHDFRREIYEFAQTGRHSKKGMVYAPLSHMDLQTVPTQHGDDRFEIISKHVHGNRILDIGANLGYFCHRFEELGYECVSVESHPDICYFLRKLHRAQARQFRIVEESIFSFVRREKPVFDTVLALSIFHHFIKEEYLYNKLITMLGTLKCGQIIFEPHSRDEGQMVGAYRNFGCNEFVDFILEHSPLTNAEKLGVAKDGREIFRLF